MRIIQKKGPSWLINSFEKPAYFKMKDDSAFDNEGGERD
jgi:hypothetical protein